MRKRGSTDWSPDEELQLITLVSMFGDKETKWDEIARALGKSREACRSHWRMHQNRLAGRLKSSPYPRYDKPLEMEAESVVIIPDPEFPFHHSEFINHVLDVAQAWKIENCIIDGDMLHFDSLSDWSPNWQIPNGKGGLDEKQETLFVDFLRTLGSRQQERGFSLLEKIGERPENGDPNVSEELQEARKALKVLAQCFKTVYVVIGNHEGRLLRQLHSPLFPTEITRLIDLQQWKIAPFYFCLLVSNGEKYIIEHPKNATPQTAVILSAKNQSHVICGHSHILNFNFDISGQYYAIMSGCAVDEFRLPYCAQRHNTKPSHSLGSTIVRDGFPYLLHPRIDWKRMERMA